MTYNPDQPKTPYQSLIAEWFEKRDKLPETAPDPAPPPRCISTELERDAGVEDMARYAEQNLEPISHPKTKEHCE